MKISGLILAAAIALLHASCSCPCPPHPCVQISPASYAPPPDPPVQVIWEHQLAAECLDSKPAKPKANNSLVPQVVLPVIPRCQEGNFSCWSTTTEMILEFLGGERIRQGEQSNQVFKRTYCTGPNGLLIADADCDSPWYPEFEKWGYNCQHREQPLNPAEVKQQIDSGLPFAFSWARKSGLPTNLAGAAVSEDDQIAHMLLAIGYGVDAQTTEQALVIIDPHPFVRSDAVIVPHHEYDGSDNSHLHWEDYIWIQPIQ